MRLLQKLYRKAQQRWQNYLLAKQKPEVAMRRSYLKTAIKQGKKDSA